MLLKLLWMRLRGLSLTVLNWLLVRLPRALDSASECRFSSSVPSENGDALSSSCSSVSANLPSCSAHSPTATGSSGCSCIAPSLKQLAELAAECAVVRTSIENFFGHSSSVRRPIAFAVYLYSYLVYPISYSCSQYDTVLYKLSYCTRMIRVLNAHSVNPTRYGALQATLVSAHYTSTRISHSCSPLPSTLSLTLFKLISVSTQYAYTSTVQYVRVSYFERYYCDYTVYAYSYIYCTVLGR